jgi:hypothetical protein
MANLRMGYIGKSFTLGALGIVGTLVACGGGGVTPTVASTATVSPYVLFASNYQIPTLVTQSSPGWDWRIAETLEGAAVYSFYPSPQNGANWGGADGVGFDESYAATTATEIRNRQSIGIQASNSTSVGSSEYFGIAVKAPENGSVNASQSNYLVIQTGNSTPTNNWGAAISHEMFTVDVSNSTVTCSRDIDLTGTRTDTNNLFRASLRTYKLALTEGAGGFTCSGGTLASLKSSIQTVAVKVVGGKDATASTAPATTAQTLIAVGLIAFAK